MSGANYEWCPVCDTKALYVGEGDVPDGIVVLHEACRMQAIAGAVAAERERIAELAGEHEAQYLIDRGDHADFRAFADLIREQP